MTPDELRKLADEAAEEPTYLGRTSKAVFADLWLKDHAPDLARLCAELAEALERVRPWIVEERFETDDDKAVHTALAKLSSLEPQ